MAYNPYARKRKERFAIKKAIKREAEIQKADAAPKQGPIGIFLDDERPCPEGWLLARNSSSLFNLLHIIDTSRLTHLALDWHLGSGAPDGLQVLGALLHPEGGHIHLLENLKVVYFHSSDRGRAIEMCRTFSKAFPEVAIEIGRPEKLDETDAMWLYA